MVRAVQFDSSLRPINSRRGHSSRRPRCATFGTVNFHLVGCAKQGGRLRGRLRFAWEQRAGAADLRRWPYEKRLAVLLFDALSIRFNEPGFSRSWFEQRIR